MITQLTSREVTIGLPVAKSTLHEALTVQIHVNWNTEEAFSHR